MLLSWVRLKTPQSSRKDAHIPIPYWPRRPPQPLSRSDLVLWHFSDMPGRSDDVRSLGQSGPPGCASRFPSLTHMRHSAWVYSVRSSFLRSFPNLSEEVEQDGRPIALARCEPQERLRLAGALEATIDHAVH